MPKRVEITASSPTTVTADHKPLGVIRESYGICDYETLIEALRQEIAERAGLPILRIYWYDGAVNQVHTPDHLAIGQLPDVKVRLGRISGKEQKGVDTLIVLDLTSLARERAISSAYLLSGDEDLREGVVAAQQLGVRVTVVGVEPVDPTRPNQAGTLIREADEHIVLDTGGIITPHFTRAPIQLPIPEVGVIPPVATLPAAPAAAGSGAAAVGPAAPQAQDLEVLGAQFAADWLTGNPPASDVQALADAKRARPRQIPQTLDAALLRSASGQLGIFTLDEESKRAVRRGFWSGLP